MDWDARWTELHCAIGAAITEWSNLEHALARAFSISLGLSLERAERMFFAMHTFSAKHDLLWEAIQSNPLEPGIGATRQAIFKSACKKAERYATTRNKLAHSRPCIAAHGSIVLGGTIVPNVISGDLNVTLDQVLTVKAIQESATAFSTLSGAINRACEKTDLASLETLLRQVRSLAPSPYSDSLGLRAASKSQPPPRSSQA